LSKQLHPQIQLINVVEDMHQGMALEQQQHKYASKSHSTPHHAFARRAGSIVAGLPSTAPSFENPGRQASATERRTRQRHGYVPISMYIRHLLSDVNKVAQNSSKHAKAVAVQAEPAYNTSDSHP
jgi:hypothetical protein